MIRRNSLLILSVLFSCTVFAQEDTGNKSQEPILGYYHLGMNFDEYWSQTQKKKEATEVTDSITMLSKYILSINGIGFDVDNIISPAADITASDNENYTKGTLPLFFTGHNYFLENKLVSITIKTPYSDANDGICYMFAPLRSLKNLSDNRCIYEVRNIGQHNQLVGLTEQLVTYLSKKYGTPVKEYPLVKLQPLHKGELSHQLSVPWFKTCNAETIFPKAEWQSGNMKILMGITQSATIFISFFDDQQLSHQNLNRIFAPAEQPKPTAEW